MDNVRSLLPIRPLATAFDHLSYLLAVIEHLNAIPLVRILTRLYNPQIFLLLSFVRLILAIFLLFLHVLFPIIVGFDESLPFLISKFLDMEGEGDELEGVLLHGSIVLFKVVVQGFFVTDMPVILHVVVNSILIWVP